MDNTDSSATSRSYHAHPVPYSWQEREHHSFRKLGPSGRVEGPAVTRQRPSHVPISQYAALNTYSSPLFRPQMPTSDLNPSPDIRYAQHWPTNTPNQHGQYHRPYSDVSCMTNASIMVSEVEPTHNTTRGHDTSDVSDLTVRNSQMSPYTHHSSTVPALNIPRSISGTREQFVPPAPASPPLPTPSTRHATTVDALTNALRAGPRMTDTQRPTLQATTSTSLRMPFADDDPASPTSIYTDTTATHQRRSDYIPGSVGQYPSAAHLSKPPLHLAPRIDEEDRSLPDSPTAQISSSPVIATRNVNELAKPSSIDRIPPSKRPTRLDMDAVRDVQARGSTSSLSDLIRRATVLASNLDRGRTASRLGLLDAFNSSAPSKKKRGSTYSDMLENFPRPEDGSIRTGSRSRGHTRDGGGKSAPAWSSDLKEKSALAKELEIEQSSLSQHERGRAYCGLRPWLFALIVLLLILSTTIAILVPIFLVLLPKVSGNGTAAISSTSCAKSNPCQNSGYALVLNDTCSCICVNGFTGSQCTISDDGTCTTADLTASDTTTYRTATVGQAVLPVIDSAKQNFTIPLNMTLLLATFSKAGLSCTSQNSLVRFNTSTGSTQHDAPNRRYIHHEPFSMFARQAAGAPLSANGIVFAPTPTPIAPPASSPTAGATAIATSTSTSMPGAASPPPSHSSFAASSVLYILQSHQSLADATTAWSLLLGYLKAAAIGTAPANHTVQISGVGDGLLANFEDLTLRTTLGARIER